MRRFLLVTAVVLMGCPIPEENMGPGGGNGSNGGRVSGRLDWFAGKGIEAAAPPRTVGDLKTPEGVPLSDHDAIALDFRLSKS